MVCTDFVCRQGCIRRFHLRTKRAGDVWVRLSCIQCVPCDGGCIVVCYICARQCSDICRGKVYVSGSVRTFCISFDTRYSLRVGVREGDCCVARLVRRKASFRCSVLSNGNSSISYRWNGWPIAQIIVATAECHSFQIRKPLHDFSEQCR